MSICYNIIITNFCDNANSMSNNYSREMNVWNCYVSDYGVGCWKNYDDDWNKPSVGVCARVFYTYTPHK